MKHEKPVGKVKPEREPDMEIKQNRHDTVLDWAAFYLIWAVSECLQ